MNRSLATTLGLMLLAVSLTFGYALGAKPASTQRAALKSSIESDRQFLEQVGGEKPQRASAQKQVQAFVDRTLGADAPTVDHRLRTRLNRIGEEMQLKGLTVGTGRAVARQTPAAARYSRRGIDRDLREMPDFTELDGSIAGEGTLEQALGLLHRIQSEPWIKRVHQVSLEPRDNGARFNVTMKVTTLFLPEKEPGMMEPPGYDAAGFGPYVSLAAANPFRVPTAPPVVAASAAPWSAEPTGFPWGQWAVTGVAEGPEGAEVWLTNRASGEARRLAIGQSLDEAVLVSASGERAEFQRGQERFVVMVGNSFDQKSTAKP